MRVYVPIVDATPSKRAYINKKKALAALKRATNKCLKRRPCLRNFLDRDDIFYLDSYELVK